MATTERRDARDDNRMSEEPIGIIISRGRRDEPVPVFSAFVWGDPALQVERAGVEPRAA
ncbi:MAG TPA: hypothetical protein VFK39_04280 [Gemmatimonadaceae bacterium]|nr:hypothetical protein [Gemmatimonadaceae bacterium]